MTAYSPSFDGRVGLEHLKVAIFSGLWLLLGVPIDPYRPTLSLLCMDDCLYMPAKSRFQDLITWKRSDKMAPICTQQNSIPGPVWKLTWTRMTILGIDKLFKATMKRTVANMTQICRMVSHARYTRFCA